MEIGKGNGWELDSQDVKMSDWGGGRWQGRRCLDVGGGDKSMKLRDASSRCVSRTEDLGLCVHSPE